MSSYLPPTENLPVFNPTVFQTGEDTGITLGEADARYLKKSGGIMTGALSVPNITINDTLTLDGTNVNDKLDEIDTNTTNITTLQQKTTDLTYDSGTDTSTFSGKLEATDDATFSNTLDAVVNIKSGSSISNNAFLKFFNAGIYKGGMYSSSDGIIINSYKVGLNFPEIQFRFEDGVISNVALEINDSNVITSLPIIPDLNGAYDIGSSSKFFSKLYSQDVETTNHTSIDTDITNLETKTQFQSASGSGGSSKTEFTNAQTIIKSNYTTYLLIKGDEDDSSTTEGAYLQFHTGQVYQGQLGSDRNSLILTSNSTSTVKPFYIKFIENGSITHTALEMNEINSIFNNNVIPNLTSTNTLGSTTKYWNHAYINDISTSNHTSLNTEITNLKTKTQYLSVSGTDLIIDTEVVKHENNNSVYLILNGDKDNNNSSQGSYLTLYAHNSFNGYLGTIGTFLDLHSFSSGTVKPIKFTFQDSVGSHTSLSCDDVDITFNVNILPETNNTFSIGESGNIFSTSYFDNIITSSHNVNTAIDTLNTKTQDLTQSGGNYELATNLFEITAGNTGDCILRLRSDQDNTNENDNCFIKFSQDGTSDRFSMGFEGGGNNNNLQFISYYVSFSTNDNFQFLVNTTDLRLGIGDDIEAHTKFISHEIEPDGNGTRALGSASNRFTTSYINDIITTNHVSIDTEITNLKTKTQFLSVVSGDQIIDVDTVSIQNISTVKLQLKSDTDNNEPALGSFLELYCHTDYQGYFGSTGSYMDLQSFSSSTVKPIKLTFNNPSTGTFTSLSCDDTDATFSVNILPSSNNTYSIGESGNIFSTSYFDNIITSSHNVNSKITTLDNRTQNISATTVSTTIGGTGHFTNIVGQFDLPNNTNVDNLLTGFGIVLTSLTDKTTDMSYSPAQTSFSGQIRSSYSVADTSVDWRGINSRKPNLNGFIKSIYLDTDREIYVGAITESGTGSNGGCAIAFDGLGGNDPNICIYCANDNNTYFGGNIYTRTLFPMTDNTYDVGSSSSRWDDIYATNSTIQTSDERQKNSIETLDEIEMKEFIKKLNPVKYKFNEKVRYHCGFISQEIKENMPFDWGLYIYNEEADSYGLRYTELIAPMISTIQNLIKDNENLKNENENLKSRLNTIEELLGIE